LRVKDIDLDTGVLTVSRVVVQLKAKMRHVYVVGGANSAGQAGVHLAKHAATVTLLVRGEGLSAPCPTT
jgi:thioredoxin reductase (NADPH)